MTLDEYIGGAEQFDWARFNCCHFAAGWVQNVTGRNVMQGLPSTETRMAAHRLINKLGGSLRAVWSAWMGEPVMPSMAQVGDVVLVHGDSIGICCGRTAAVLTEVGVAHAPMTMAIQAWRVK